MRSPDGIEVHQPGASTVRESDRVYMLGKTMINRFTDVRCGSDTPTHVRSDMGAHRGPGGDARTGILRVGLAVLVLLLTAAPHATAQDVRVGVRAGPTFGFLNDRAVPFMTTSGLQRGTPHARVDFHVGAFAILPLSGPIGLQGEVLYLRKGGHFSSLENLSETDPVYSAEQYQLSYVQGQVLVRTDLSPSGPLSVHALLGLSLDAALRGELTRDVRTRRTVFHQQVSLLDHDLLRPWGVGGVLGVSVGYPVGSARRIALDVRYNPGFRSVFTGAGAPTRGKLTRLDRPLPLMGSPPKMRHDVITLGVSYTVPLGGSPGGDR